MDCRSALRNCARLAGAQGWSRDGNAMLYRTTVEWIKVEFVCRRSRLHGVVHLEVEWHDLSRERQHTAILSGEPLWFRMTVVERDVLKAMQRDVLARLASDTRDEATLAILQLELQALDQADDRLNYAPLVASREDIDALLIHQRSVLGRLLASIR